MMMMILNENCALSLIDRIFKLGLHLYTFKGVWWQSVSCVNVCQIKIHQIKICPVLFLPISHSLSLSLFIYIYIYIYICVCVCIYNVILLRTNKYFKKHVNLLYFRHELFHFWICLSSCYFYYFAWSRNFSLVVEFTIYSSSFRMPVAFFNSGRLFDSERDYKK